MMDRLTLFGLFAVTTMLALLRAGGPQPVVRPGLRRGLRAGLPIRIPLRCVALRARGGGLVRGGSARWWDVRNSKIEGERVQPEQVCDKNLPEPVAFIDD
jgi:hypothetical protein